MYRKYIITQLVDYHVVGYHVQRSAVFHQKNACNPFR
jgi:hypothetical protein